MSKQKGTLLCSHASWESMDELAGRKIELPCGAIAWWPCHVATQTIGVGTVIGALAHIGRDVVIGDNCRIQGTAYIADKTQIGSEVFIGPGAVITNDRHPPSNGRWSPIMVADKAIIGANATLVAGIRIGEGSVVAAGAVVTKDVPPNEVWGGNPAKFLMGKSEYEHRRGTE
ncbi:MAG TPA: N-acetyltransferase [Candidatus Poseidoniales archaeon]|nr:N-acetyltransferase [Candidatus Poseidoniales archaeon]